MQFYLPGITPTFWTEVESLPTGIYNKGFDQAPSVPINQLLVAFINRPAGTEVGVFLNDALVDLTKPITVIANGEETRFSETRKFSQSLELVKLGRNDAGRYFVATKVVRLPARAAAPAEGEGAGGDSK